jgi:hypothetical protein
MPHPEVGGLFARWRRKLHWARSIVIRNKRTWNHVCSLQAKELCTFCKSNEQGRQCMFNVTLSDVRVTLVATKTQQRVPIVLFTCVCRCQQCNKTQSVATKAQPCVICIVTLHMSLQTIRTHFGAHAKCPILTNLMGVSRQIFVRVPNIKFHKNPPSGNHPDICRQTDRQMRDGQIWRI